MADNIAYRINRSAQILMDAPVIYAMPFFRLVVQEVDLSADGAVLGSRQGSAQVVKSVADAAADLVTVEDPTLGSDVTISGAGLQRAIKALSDRYLEDRGLGVVTPGIPLKVPVAPGTLAPTGPEGASSVTIEIDAVVAETKATP